MKTLGLLALVSSLVVPASAGLADDDSPRHLIYLHGRIVQLQQDPRPVHPQFGPYELDEILAAFRERGFVVTGEIRPKSASEDESADHVVGQVRALLESGIPGDRITVVGASAGGGIALKASTRLQEPDVRFAVLGNCLTNLAARLRTSEGKELSGHVLSVREVSDELTQGCTPWKMPSANVPYTASELVVHTGLSHGFLYRPLSEWLNPFIEWISSAGAGQHAPGTPSTSASSARASR